MAAMLPFNWGQYLGDGTATGGVRDSTFSTQEGWQQALNWVKQFDPNASLQSAMTAGGDQGQYLSFNNALLPQNQMGGRGVQNAANLGALRDANRYSGPRAQDANLGDIGHSMMAANTLRDRGTWLDIVGPMLVGGLAGFAGGGLGMMGQAMTKAPSLLANLFQGQSSMTPQQLLLMRILAMRNSQPGG